MESIPTPAKRAILYARVSTDDQATEGYSLPSQLRKLREHAKRKGYEVVGEYEDDFTGRKASRPKFDQVLRRLRDDEADALIVLSQNRFMRNTGEHIRVRDELLAAGRELSYAEGLQLDGSADAEMFDTIGATFAQWWSDKIGEATRRAMTEKALRGFVPGMGTPRYGYRYDHETKGLVIHDAEAAIVRQIYAWYLHGDEDGHKLTGYAIAKRLTLEGVPTPIPQNDKRRRKVSVGWHENTIVKILSDEVYCGTFRYGKTAKIKGRTVPRPANEHVVLSVPAIVDRAMLDASRERRAANAAMASRNNTRNAYLLRGRIACARCKHAMTGHTKTETGRQKYVCAGRARRGWSKGAQGRCTQHSLLCAEIDAVVWEHALGLITGDGFEHALRDAQQAERDAAEPQRQRIDELNVQLRDAERDAAALADSIGLLKQGGAVARALQAKIDAADARYADLLAERDRLAGQAERPTFTDARIADLMAFRVDALEGLALATFDDKRDALEALDLRTEADGTKITVSCALGVTRRSIDKSAPTSCGVCRSACGRRRAGSAASTRCDARECRRHPRPSSLAQTRRR
jgi:site-specific DNA recombinase